MAKSAAILKENNCLEDKMYNKIFNKDCLEYLESLEDKSVDLFLLDPPYMGVVKDDWDNQWRSIEEYREWCDRWIELCAQKGKYSNSLWVFGFPYQLCHILPLFEKHGFSFRQQVVVWKGMKSAAGRTSDKLKMFPTTTESIFYFAYDSIPEIKRILNEKKNATNLSGKQINEYLGKASNGGGTWSQIAGLKQKTPEQPTRQDWEKLGTLFGGLPDYDDMVYKFNLPFGLTDVWDDIRFYFKRGTKLHTTQKPELLIERIIKASSDEDDFVVDLFLGSGTTAYCSKKLNRNYGGCEIDSEYYEKSVKRLKTLEDEWNTY